MPFFGIVELADLNGADGFQLIGEAANSQLGYSISSAGGINGDGIDDFIVGAKGYGSSSSSAAFNASQLSFACWNSLTYAI